MKSTTKLVVCAVLFLGACTTSEPSDFTQNVPVMSPDAAAGSGGQSGATNQQSGAGAGGSVNIGGQSGSAGAIMAAGGMDGGAGSPAPGRPDAGAQDAGVVEDAAIDARSNDAGMNATWTDIYSRLLNNPNYASNCTGAPCHDPGTQKGLDLSTQAKGYSTVKGKLVVGSPNSSKIVSQLSSGAMPQARPKMPAADLAVIKAWIMAGAPNN
jgi:hypothetical protein